MNAFNLHMSIYIGPDVLLEITNLAARVGADILPPTSGADEDEVGPSRPPPSTTMEFKSHLERLFAAKRVLIVLDDVWYAHHAAYFDFTTASGSRSQILITTRVEQLLGPRSSASVSVGRLSEDQAVWFLAASAGLSHDDLSKPDDSAAARRLVGSLDMLPLAIAMVGAALTFSDATVSTPALEGIPELVKLSADLSSSDDEPVGKAMAYAIKRLHSGLVTSYQRLAVLREDTDAPLPMLRRLWKCDVDKAQAILKSLAGRRLVAIHDSGAEMRCSLHDLQRDHLVSMTDHSELAKIHAELVASYQVKDDGTGSLEWPLVPADGYIHRHLVYHMTQGEMKGGAAQLVQSLEWLERQVRATGSVAASVADATSLEEGADIAEALALSAHVAIENPHCLAFQLAARLEGSSSGWASKLGNDALMFLAKSASKGCPTIVPQKSVLRPPGTALRRVLAGHSDWIRCVKVVDDGKTLLTGAADGCVKMWDVAAGVDQATMQLGEGGLAVLCLAREPHDGPTDRVVCGCSDGGLHLLSLNERAVKRTVSCAHGKGVNAIAYLKGKVATAGSDGKIGVWNSEDLTGMGIFDCGDGSVYGICAASNGETVVAGGEDGVIRLFSSSNMKLLGTLEGHTDCVRCVDSIVPAGRNEVVASCGDDRLVMVWDLDEKKVLHRISSHGDWVFSLAFVPGTNPQLLVSVSDDRSVGVQCCQSGKTLYQMEGHADGIFAVDCSSDGSFVVSASGESGRRGTLMQWDISSNRSGSCVPKRHRDGVTSVAARGDLVATASDDCEVMLWSASTGDALGSLSGHTDGVKCVDISHDGRLIASGGTDDSVRAWSATDQVQIWCAEGEDTIFSVRFLPGDTRLASAGWDGTISIRGVADGALLLEVAEAQDDAIFSMAVVDGSHLLSGGKDGVVKLWDLVPEATANKSLALEEQKSFQEHSARVLSVATSEGGKRAVSVSWDLRLQVYNLRAKTPLYSMDGHPDWVRGVYVAVTGQWIITASWDKAVVIRSLEDGAVARKEYFDRPLTSVAATSTHVVVGDNAGSFHILALQSGH